MKAKLLWLGLSGLVAFFSFALLPGPQPAAPSAVAPIPPSANTLRLVRVGAEPTPVPDTNGVPVPGETPYDDRPEAKAHYLQSYCNGYRLAAINGSVTTSCYFGPMPPPENVQAANAGWIAGQIAGLSSRQPQFRVTRREVLPGQVIETIEFP